MKKRKNPSAVALGRRRTKSLSPERRKEIAQQGAQKRWGNRNPYQFAP